MKSFLRYNLPSILWAAFILWLCLLPGRDLPSVTLWQADKLGHFAVYAVLSLLLYYGWKKQNHLTFLHRHTFLKILLLTTAYGFAVEVLQEALTTDRQFDIYDALANAAGAVAGSVLAGRVFGQKTA